MRKDFTFKSSDGIHDIHAAAWEPESGRPHAVIQLIHGMNEYIGRYDDFAEFLSQNGFLVVGHDHLGHGDSVQDNSELGYISKEPFRDLLNDINRLRVMTEMENEGLPYFMLGHSMGSFLLRSYLANRGKGITAAVIMGTGYNAPAKVRGGMALVKAVSLAKGEKYRDVRVQALVNGSPSFKGFDLNGKKPENSWLSRNTENVTAYYKDPKCRYLFTMNGYMGLLSAVLFSCSTKNMKKVPYELPLLFVSGSEDPVGDKGEGVKKVYGIFEQQRRHIKNAAAVDIKLFSDDRHEILNEIDRMDVYKYILEWLGRFF